MKKLMIVLGLVAMAAVSAQASKVKWNISGVGPYGEDEDTTGYLMVCLCESATVGTTLEGVYTSRTDPRRGRRAMARAARPIT